MITPYFDDGTVQLYHGRLEDVLPTINVRPDLVVADPPYAETSLEWDIWPDGWPAVLAGYASSMWVFGSMRMFLERYQEFRRVGPRTGWKLSQDVVWQKDRRTTVATDRFARIHEHALHWYRGPWSDVHHVTPKVARVGPAKGIISRSAIPSNIRGDTGAVMWEDDGTRWQSTVINAPSVWRTNAINATQKPEGVLTPLITYGCPPGGLVLDPFAGSCSTLIAARNTGRRAIGIEAREEQCETAALRLSQGTLEFG